MVAVGGHEHSFVVVVVVVIVFVDPVKVSIYAEKELVRLGTTA
jgi:hypothetical protein